MMAEYLPTTPNIYEDYPTAMEGPYGSALLTFQPYTSYEMLAEGEMVNTLAIDFVTPQFLDPDTIAGIVNEVAGVFSDNNQELLAYALFGGLTKDVVIPTEVSIGDWIFTLPWGGTSIVTLNEYRLWILTRDSAVMGQISYRPFIGAWTTAIVAGDWVYTNIFKGTYPWSVPPPTGHMPFSELFRAVAPIPPYKYVPLPPKNVPIVPTQPGGKPLPADKKNTDGLWMVGVVAVVGLAAWLTLAYNEAKGGR
jgi:hypothetical protein